MRKLALTALWLICVLGLSACKSGGGAVPPACPVLAPVPADLMKKPDYRQRVLDELIEPSPSAKPKS